MRLAVFANQFPSAFSTYFARDMRGLIEAGVDVEVFPIYPLDNKLWESVPSILNENILPRNKIHHVSLRELTKVKSENNLRMMARLIADMACIGISASRYGIGTSLKSAYVALKAWILAQKYPRGYDHVLAYWGNYAATCVYIYHRLCKVQ